MIKSLTGTNADIQLKGDATAEVLNVSRQRLSLCSSEMSQSIPWVGHSGKLRKRRQIRQQNKTDSAVKDQPDVLGTSTMNTRTSEQSASSGASRTRSGRLVKP